MTSRLYITAFISGLVSLALEMAASRLLEPFFGTSNLVWAAIIGLILLFLSAGYAIGGRWADRYPQTSALYTILAAAGIAIAVIPFITRPVLLIAAQGVLAWNAGQVVATFIAVLILFAVPVTLLACVSPFVIRLALTDLQLSGITAGKVYAISTAGSFLGTFLPGFLLIPQFGTRQTFLLLGLLTLITGLWGLWKANRHRFWLWLWAVPLILALFFLRADFIKPQAGLIYETESAYNFIQVVEKQDVRFLLLNEGQGVHSVSMPENILTGGTWDYFLIAPYFNTPPHPPQNVNSLLVIGLAAGTIPAQYTSVYGPIAIDGVEIDPAIVEVGREYFGMTQPNLNVHTTDGRYFLKQSNARYDVVAVDAYRLPYIPWHLTTVEFFQEIRQHLTEKGVVSINVGHTPDDWRLVESLAATMKQVYPSVHVISVPKTFNAILIATVTPTTTENLAANLTLIENAKLHTVGERAQANFVTVDPSRQIFTDDKAPIELLTDTLVLQYILGDAS